MNNIDTATWKEFLVKDLFITEIYKNELQVPTGASISAKDLDDGDIPKISVSGYNNGIVGYYSSKSKNFRVYNNFISVSFLGAVFYQKNDAFLDMKVHCLKPKDVSLNEYSGVFLTTIIKRSLEKFDYGDQISSTVLPKLSLKLPVDNNGNPDWKYMEEYMRVIETKSVNKLLCLKNTNANSTILNTGSWKRFNLYDNYLFKIDSGNKFDKSKMSQINPSINFVGRSTVNNGVTCIVDLIDNIKPYEKGNLTLALGGEHLGSCFIQEKDFYTSQNVNVLIPNHEMSLNVKLFISLMIYKESRTYYKAFEDELNRHIMTDFTILLPIDKSGCPDWKYMDEFISIILNRSQDNINLFKNLSHQI